MVTNLEFSHSEGIELCAEAGFAAERVQASLEQIEDALAWVTLALLD